MLGSKWKHGLSSQHLVMIAISLDFIWDQSGISHGRFDVNPFRFIVDGWEGEGGTLGYRPGASLTESSLRIADYSEKAEVEGPRPN